MPEFSEKLHKAIREGIEEGIWYAVLDTAREIARTEAARILDRPDIAALIKAELDKFLKREQESQ